MATLFKILSLCIVLTNICTYAQLSQRNTIFGDEKIPGGIFEYLDVLSDVIPSDDDNPYRLPNDTLPLHYNLFLNVDISNLSFSGRVEIDIVATRPGVSQIVLHSNHTELTSIILTLKGDNNNIPLTHTVEETPFNFLTIRPNADLEYNAVTPIIYTLDISFRAPLRTEMNGLYRSWFRNNYTDNESWMATTHFQATGARFAFPCYDEPQLKATFKLTIRRPINYGSWFCTKKINTVPAVTGYEDDIFSETPIMSTYLLAMIVAQYKSLEIKDNNGVLMYEVIGRPSALDNKQGEYALEVGQKLLAKMSEHTDYDFYSVHPNLKMTQASIPDFSAGAMENWGLLVYREAYLMYDEIHTNSYYKQLIAYILSHEIAHMWFGNLVTCNWWGMLWLNEGFARYYQYFLTDWVEDYMGFEARFITEQVHTSLLSDSANTHALTTPGLGSPVEVRTMFTTISYNKGASILRMTEHMLGHEVQRLGLRNYLRNRSFQTARPIDLFNALQAAGTSQNALLEYGLDFSLVEYFKSWSDQPGHPVLHVNVNHQTGDMTITQRRFNINTGYAATNFNYIVPITFTSASNPDFNNTKPTHILKDSVSVINRGTVGDEWVIFNKQQTGFYRVNYDDYTWNLIINALRGPERTTIHEFNRAQIVNDVFQFARSGLMTYTRAFNILSFLINETAYTPWVAAMTGFSWIRNRLAGTSQLGRLDALIVEWATPVMTNLGYYESENEEFMRSYLRYQLAPFMCTMNVAACKDAATTLFQRLVITGVEVPADSRNWVYCEGLRSGQASYFDEMWRRYQQHNVYTEKILLLQTLGCTTDPSSLDTFLKAIVQDNFTIRPQDYTTAWNAAITSNEVNTQIAFAFVKNNLADVIAAFNGAATPISYISSRLRTEAEINEFQNWATENREALGSEFNAVFNGAESSRQSINWARNVAADIDYYLNNGNDEFTLSTSTTETPQVIVTTARPPLPDIVDPTLPSSATTCMVSVTFVILSVFISLF